ncbi:MAG: ATP-binding cassette domain-containing protein [Corynebacterium sp.]|nr:ATP-binding cassette domain-containing protein [Corynebacterium sp.]
MPASISIKLSSWTHPGRTKPALENIDVEIPAGQRVLIMGCSGSGKSTLLGILAGLLHNNCEVSYSPAAPRIGMVLQDPETQVIYSRVGDDIAFGLENIGIPREQIWQRVAEAKIALGLDHLSNDQETVVLSGGQKQRMAIAGVLAMNPDILVLDEPVANVDRDGSPLVADSVQKAIEYCGATTIIVDHDAELWLNMVDRVLVLDAGQILYDLKPEELTGEYAQSIQALGLWLPGELPTNDKKSPIPGESVLEAHDLAWGWDHVLGSSEHESYAQGTSTIISGPNGIGKSTHGLTLAGLLQPLRGRLNPQVNKWKSKNLAAYIGYVFQDPNHQFLRATVEEELNLGAIMTKTERQELLEKLGLEHYINVHPAMLSGGEKRRLSVATALVRTPAVLILDEPTFGLDRRTFGNLTVLLHEAQTKGSALISISHDPRYIQLFGGENV